MQLAVNAVLFDALDDIEFEQLCDQVRLQRLRRGFAREVADFAVPFEPYFRRYIFICHLRHHTQRGRVLRALRQLLEP